MKKTNKKGFTIVELVIVIAVIAILAAVLIPNISRLVKKANQSADESLVRNLNTALAMDAEKHTTMSAALNAAYENGGYDVAKIVTKNDDAKILWDSLNDCFVYLNGTEKVYLPNTQTEKDVENWNYFEICNEMPTEQKYSIYANWEGTTLDKELTVGFDAGKNVFESLTFKTEEARTVIINTNGGALTVEAKKANVMHYGKATNVEVVAVKNESYHEYGTISGNISVKEGHIKLEAKSSVNSIVITANDITKISITQDSSATIANTIIATEEAVRNSLATASNIKVDAKVKEEAAKVVFANSENLTNDNFIDVVTSGKYVVLTSDVELNPTDGFAILNSKVKLDLNGHTLTIKTTDVNFNGYDYTALNLYGTEAIILNGSIVVEGKTGTGYSVVLSMFGVLDGSKCELVNVTVKAEKNSAIFPDDKSELILKGCTVVGKTYAIATNASKAQVDSPAINIAIYDSVLTVTAPDGDNAALCVNVPSVVYVENSKITGERQAVIIRGATATFKDCELTTKATYSSKTKYYDTTWGGGNEVPVAALTVGNRSTSAYNYPTNVTLLNTKLVVEGNNSDVYALYAYGLTKDNYTVSISYDSACQLGKTNLENGDIGNVTVTKVNG